MIRGAVLLLLLAGCTSPPTPPQVPSRLQVCPDAVYAPPAPPSPRAIKALVAWARQIETAREKTETARRECAGRLDALNLWILKHQKD